MATLIVINIAYSWQDAHLGTKTTLRTTVDSDTVVHVSSEIVTLPTPAPGCTHMARVLTRNPTVRCPRTFNVTYSTLMSPLEDG